MTMITVPCPHCDGRGLVEAGMCTARRADGRPCRRPQRYDPKFFEEYPDRADLKTYCVLHGNRILQERRTKLIREAMRLARKV